MEVSVARAYSSSRLGLTMNWRHGWDELLLHVIDDRVEEIMGVRSGSSCDFRDSD